MINAAGVPRPDAALAAGRGPAASWVPRLDESWAREVAAMFLTARSTPQDPAVRAAYRALERETDRTFDRLTTPGVRPWVAVMFTTCGTPYCSDQEMITAVCSTHLLEVTTAAAERGRGHPLLAGERGGAYDRFRAVHDLLGHVSTGLGFDRDGEFGAWLAQERLHSPLARLALGTELHGEHSVRWTTGAVAEHKATILDHRALARSRRGRTDPPA